MRKHKSVNTDSQYHSSMRITVQAKARQFHEDRALGETPPTLCLTERKKGGTNMYKNQNTDVDDLIFGQTETIVSDR